MLSHDRDTQPWYRQFWPWVLIALPSTVVVASLVTIAIALHEPDGLVADDYYKEGLAINRSLARDRAAVEHGLTGNAALIDGRLVLTLASADGRLPRDLQIRLLHATRAGRDRQVAAVDTGNNTYTAMLATLGPGRWHLHVLAEDWRLVGALRVPQQLATELKPAL